MTVKTIVIIVIGVLLGGAAGYLYYTEIGCLSGTCPITSKLLNSTLYGGVVGGLLFHTFVKQKKK